MTQAMAGRCADAGVPYLDLSQAVSDWRLWWDQAAARDGSHPGAEAYALIADAVMNWPAWRSWLGLS